MVRRIGCKSPSCSRQKGGGPQWQAAADSLASLEPVPQLASWRKVRYLLEDGLKYIFQVNLSPDQLPVVLDEIQAMADEFSGE